MQNIVHDYFHLLRRIIIQQFNLCTKEGKCRAKIMCVSALSVASWKLGLVLLVEDCLMLSFALVSLPRVDVHAVPLSASLKSLSTVASP